jgi:hypothetical protein
MTKKLLGMGVVGLAAVAFFLLAARAELENDLVGYTLYFGVALIVAAVVGIIRDRGHRPTIEGQD